MKRLLPVCLCVLLMSSTGIIEEKPVTPEVKVTNTTLWKANLGVAIQSYKQFDKSTRIRLILFNCSYFYGIDYGMLERLVDAESSGREYLVSKNKDGTKDTGLFQINSAYLKYFAWRYNHGIKIGEFDSAMQAQVASKYLLHLYECTGSWYLAVCAYNCGLTKVREHRIPDSTKAYALKILDADTLNRESGKILWYYLSSFL